MSWESHEPIVQILHTLGNPTRKATIEALWKNRMRFSQLLAACGLNYDHDAGHFSYHLSELIDKRIVEKAGDTYRLTDFGEKTADMLYSLEKECSFLFAEASKGGERKVDMGNLETEWIEFGKETSFEKKTEKQFMWTSFYTETSSLQEAISKQLSEGPERGKLLKFLEELKSWKGPVTLVAKDKDIPLGWAVVQRRVSWGWKGDKVTEPKDIFARTYIIAEDLVIQPQPWAKDRKEVALTLLKELLNKAQQTGADEIQLMRVDAEDSEVIEALKDLGFERIAISYSMRKALTG